MRMTPSEKTFAERVDSQGKTWQFQPKRFTLPPPYYSYTPDFYILEDDCYYEVCGTRQAFSYIRRKFETFREVYPDVQLHLVNIRAWKKGPISARKVQVKNQKPRKTVRFESVEKYMRRKPPTQTASEILNMIEGMGCKSLREFCRIIDVNPAYLSLLLRGKASGKLKIYQLREKFNAVHSISDLDNLEFRLAI